MPQFANFTDLEKALSSFVCKSKTSGVVRSIARYHWSGLYGFRQSWVCAVSLEAF